jgi:hypothetical protein
MSMYGKCTWANSFGCRSCAAAGSLPNFGVLATQTYTAATQRDGNFHDHLTIPSNFHAKLLPLASSGGYTAMETNDYRYRYKRLIKD